MLIDGYELELPMSNEQVIRAVDQESYTRIDLLTKYYFKIVIRDKSGWIPLLHDPDGCYWIKEFPHGSFHGGGRPLLRRVTSEEAIEIFGPEW